MLVGVILGGVIAVVMVVLAFVIGVMVGFIIGRVGVVRADDNGAKGRTSVVSASKNVIRPADLVTIGPRNIVSVGWPLVPDVVTAPLSLNVGVTDYHSCGRLRRKVVARAQVGIAAGGRGAVVGSRGGGKRLGRQGVVVGWCVVVIWIVIIVNVIPIVDEFVAVAIGESESGRHSLGATDRRDAGDDVVRHREFGKMRAGDEASGGYTVEVVGTLFIAGGTHADGANGTWRHRVVVLFMGVGISTERDPHMFVIVNAAPFNEIAWRMVRRYGVWVGKGVLPKNGILSETDDHDSGDKLERHVVVCRADGVFGGTNVSLDVGDMFVGPAQVEIVAWQ